MTKQLLELKDEAIVSKFKITKNARYFKMMMLRHQHRLYNTAFRIVGGQDEAEEIVQETFIKALQNINNFNTNASLSAWLYSIAHNLCIDALRLKQKNGEYRHEYSKRNRHMAHQLPDRLPGPAEQAELKEQMELISHSLESLPKKQRTVVLMHDIAGLPYEHIATVIGISIGTVRSRLHYGRSRLKKILYPYLNHMNISENSPKKTRRQCAKQSGGDKVIVSFHS